MAVIASVRVREILDSRGEQTVEAEVEARDEAGGRVGFGRAAAPSGASRGVHEVVAFPPGGVSAALREMKKISPKLVDLPVGDQERIDSLLRELDGTPNLRRLGGNTVVAISLAVAKAAAGSKGLELYEYLGKKRAVNLPYPLGNVLGGGKHAGKRAPDIQEFLCLPLGARRFVDAARANARVHQRARALVEHRDETFTGGKGDEGAWAPNLDNASALELLVEACEGVGEELGIAIKPALDMAASSLYDSSKGEYSYKREGATRDPGEQLEYVLELIKTHKLAYVEDPFHEDDFTSFAELTRKAGKRCLICGDDLFVTNVARIKQGIELGAANAVLIKPNQIGTLTDTLAAVRLTKEKNLVPVMSHRSGETPDETIAHLAVGLGCPMIKTGVVGGERVAKLNELIRIEQKLGELARMGELKW